MKKNIKTIAALALLLKVEPAKIEAALFTDEADETKHVDKIGDIVTADIVIVPKAEFDKPTPGTFIHNYQKAKYERGSTDGVAMRLKTAKELHKVPADVEINTFDELIKYVSDKALEEAKIEPTTAVKNLTKDKETLQLKLTAAEKELTEVKAASTGTAKMFDIKAKVLEGINALNIDAPASVLNNQKTLVMNAFMAEHEFQDQDGKMVIVNKNTKAPLQDDKLNNLDIAAALKLFAPTYVVVKDGKPENGGRGDGSSNGSLPVGDVKNIKTKDELNKYLADKKISATSDEALAIFREVKKNVPDLK